MREMLSVLTDVRGVCLLPGLNRQRHVQCTPHAVYAGSSGAAFAKCIWPLVFSTFSTCTPFRVF